MEYTDMQASFNEFQTNLYSIINPRKYTERNQIDVVYLTFYEEKSPLLFSHLPTNLQTTLH